MFHRLPDSAWADGNLAKAAGQLGEMGEHPNLSQPKPGRRADGTPCKICKYEQQAPDPGSNTLLHVVSTLELHVSSGSGSGAPSPLPLSAADEANYTCRSSDNDVGPPVESSTEFRVHYPPRNISVSHRWETNNLVRSLFTYF